MLKWCPRYARLCPVSLYHLGSIFFKHCYITKLYIQIDKYVNKQSNYFLLRQPILLHKFRAHSH